MAQPVNNTQREYEKLRKLGGGLKRGPASGKVGELLRSSGKRLNQVAYEEMAEHVSAFSDANPWHICFAVGLIWGHLAKNEVSFTGHVTDLLQNWNDDDLAAAKTYFMERGLDPIEQPLIGAYTLFSRVTLPLELPNTLSRLDTAQQRWLTPILNPASRPKYIGSWNATAMFMTALFAQPELAATQYTQRPLLPPGGPIFNGLKILFADGVLSRAPAGSELDDEAFEPGALYENNQLFVDLLGLQQDWSLIDVHSGVYMLGTRDPRSNGWV